MLKIHRFFVLFFAAFITLTLLTAGIVFYNTHSNRVQALALESVKLHADWNMLQNETNQILLDRYTIRENEIPYEITKWTTHYKDFSKSLDKFAKNKQIQKLDHIPEKIDGIIRVWRFTEVQLNNADHFFLKIIQTGLGEKVMVNGFLHTMYKLRMSDQLTVSEIFLLDDTVYALESLDNATKEFDTLFTLVMLDLEMAGDLYLQRVRIFSIVLSVTVLLIMALLVLVQRQLKASQENRSLYLKDQKNQLLKKLVCNSCEENLELFNRRKEELGIKLKLSEAIQPLALQIDDYSLFSHQHNIAEQDKIINRMTGSLETMIRNRDMVFESFRYGEDMIVFLINSSQSDENENLKEWFELNHGILLEENEISTTMTFGLLNTEEIDLDQDFSRLLQLTQYRFISGKGSFIYSGSSSLTSKETFHYPLDKEKHFVDAMNTLNESETLKILDDLIGYGNSYGPQNMRRLIIRFTATLISIVETLERTYHIHSIDNVTPMILRIQNPETIKEVKELLSEIILKVIHECSEMKEAKHDNTVIHIKEIIDAELNDLNLSADSIADRFQLTSSYLNRLFKQHSSYSIAGYINHCRLDKAELLLRTSDFTVKEIAEQSGFASMGTFFRLFKKEFGRTPGDYHKEALIP
ncbi:MULTISPECIES: helix-turn-helix transcriptional regulator [unclassified Oceanispirochaeta]|uniref:helix-turn-helix transcriptional regulator n=1 Tax=unclassified Oceanispirochaeta TaxID=2635722 RepID=UPI000E09DCC6|nr:MULTISPECIES: helix-turn-helix transcriptional regulator [unclassified Oceanispirochaeta]MBF9017545.1 helix-turn-helix domain-containing protein [Oceanispirochaeta sp. M2]NPD74117.1 helix-turn-helix domain-containing protein [Oceanispirochaeta sp. M1]RDG30039.1 helix-turn-helix domain-containing protein [Oceanispirochaeta sp. M1]